jgi:hypothetical protein
MDVRVGIQTITRTELELAARRGRVVRPVVIGWAHLSRRVTPELAERALGRVTTVGLRTGFSRLS